MNPSVNFSIWKRIPLISWWQKRAMIKNRSQFFSSGFDFTFLTSNKSCISNRLNVKPRFSSKGRKLARLTEFPVFIWPSFFYMQSTIFLERFLINDYDDPSFDYSEFALLALTLVDSVSGCISIKDYKGLRRLVTPDAIEDVKAGIDDASMEELSHFWTRSRDVVFSFPHEITSVKYGDSSRVAEILMVFHVVKGSYKRLHYPKAPLSPSELVDNVQILNYRFRRLLDVQDNSLWIVNGLNHVRFFNETKKN